MPIATAVGNLAKVLDDGVDLDGEDIMEGERKEAYQGLKGALQAFQQALRRPARARRDVSPSARERSPRRLVQDPLGR
eukprot:2272412-Alexandrium_andersonii.AAC.1